jgi:teichuronic acid biosynthesis glycosyltransferase TuaC
MVVTFHGSDLQGFWGSNGQYTIAGCILRFLSRYIANRAEKVIVVSEHLTKYLPNRLPVNVIPCGVDFDIFRPIPQLEARRKLGLEFSKLLVLFAANPNNPIKRYALTQKAVELIKTRFDVELVTVYRASHDLIPLYMNACDVLILTSAHEGSPTVIKEALACNLPVVSVDVGDVRRHIENIAGCVLCSDCTPEAIADGLAKVLHARRRIAGRDAISEFDGSIVAKRIIEVYHSALR